MRHTGVVVVGSANMDLVVRSARFPRAGETLLGGEFSTHPGGKGANQAVAAGRLGGQPAFVAKLGDDLFAKSLLQSLESAGVQTEHIRTEPGVATGIAVITVDAAGENTIVVASGANMRLTPDEVRTALGSLRASVLLAQLEVPLETVMAAREAFDGTFVLNPAPARELPPELLARVDVLTPNESEAERLTGVRPTDEVSCRQCADAFHAHGVRHVVITLGARGCFVSDGTTDTLLPAFPVDAVDTTAAGDAFSGALAQCLAEGGTLEHAARFASAAAALSTTRHGAQESMPTREEVSALIAGREGS